MVREQFQDLRPARTNQLVCSFVKPAHMFVFIKLMTEALDRSWKFSTAGSAGNAISAEKVPLDSGGDAIPR